MRHDIPVTIYTDSASAMKLAENEAVNQQNKHIDIQLHFARDVVQNKVVSPQFLKSREMLADMLTKPLQKVLQHRFRELSEINQHDM